MSWVSEMISAMRSRKSAEEDKTKSRHAERLPIETVAKPIPGAKEAWTELLLHLKSDVKEFNGDDARAGHSAVLTSGEKSSIARFQFEVYVPELDSKLLVLTMSGNKVDVEVRPEFPEQKAAIAVEAVKSGKGYRWLLDGLENEKEVTPKQLSEYLLRPILCSAALD